MAQTVQNVIDAALNRNSLNDADKLAGDAEMIGVVSRKQQQKFLKVGEVNPDFFGASNVYTLTAGKEILLDQIATVPAMVTYIEVNEQSGSNHEVGDKVHIVESDNQDAELSPRMIRQLNKFVSVGSDLGGVTKVEIFYCILPATLDTTNSPGDITLDMPDHFIDTLITELALHLAIKDNRSDAELDVLRTEIADAENNLLRAAEFSQKTKRRFSR